MTAFEIIVAVAIIVIAVLLIWQTHRNTKANERHAEQIRVMCETLSNIRGDTVDIFQELNSINDNILDDLRDIRLADKLGKTSPNVPAPIPCYAPNGICTNPQMDCINCPKRGTGGSWSTSTNTINGD